MKKNILLGLILVFVFAFNACNETTSNVTSSSTVSSNITQSTTNYTTTYTDPTIREFYDEEFGLIRLSNLSIPSGVTVYSATYTYSGKVLLTIPGGLAIINDDGSDYHQIWQGSIPRTSGSNGARYLPFQDNERILLGDYILECYPNIDNCQTAELVPIAYPESITNDIRTLLHYSEVIISPDNVHMAWTVIRKDFWSANAIGELSREEDKYVLNNVKIISTLDYFTVDPDNDGYLLVNQLYGGEVKEFIWGGAGISTAGACDFGTARPMFQSLVDANINPLSYALGYEETGMVSPDGTLAIIMSTRDSDSSNFAFLDLMPTPSNIYITMNIMLFIYQHSVSQVRTGAVEGNIGPVLVDVEKSMSTPEYEGIQLNDPEGEWIYLSPISWNDDSTKGMWLERSLSDYSTRVRIVELLDKNAATPEKIVDLNLDDIPYALELTDLYNFIQLPTTGKIAGEGSGYISFTDNVSSQSLEYVNYSIDGETFYNGIEKVFMEENYIVYTSNVVVTGANSGIKDIRLTFSQQGLLIFDLGSDNLPMSRGYCQYNGIEINVWEVVGNSLY